MRPSWKFLRIVFVVLIVSMCAAVAHADSIADPKIIIDDPACPSGGCIQVGLNFTFSTPARGTGVLFFTNASGVDWFNLKLTEVGVAANAITCITNAFANCSVQTVSGLTTILLSGIGGNRPGLGAGQNFQVELGCRSGKCNPWPGDLEFTAQANVPEPGTMALLFTGIGALVARRKLLSRARA